MTTTKQEIAHVARQFWPEAGGQVSQQMFERRRSRMVDQIMGVLEARGWSSPREARQRELHHFEAEQENADLKAENGRLRASVGAFSSARDAAKRQWTEEVTDLKDRVESLQRSLEEMTRDRDLILDAKMRGEISRGTAE